MHKLKSIAWMMLLLMTSCAPNTPAISLCDHDGVILVSRRDILTPGTERQILAHNEAFKALCR